MSDQNYRLYSFVANGYLSPLQCGLQTAHAIAEMSIKYSDDTQADHAYRTWAGEDKTIIICAAFNSKGVIDCVSELNRTCSALALPVSIFYEDIDSLNGAPTACAVVVPQKYWDVKPVYSVFEGDTIGWQFIDTELNVTKFPLTHPEGQFIDHIKGYRLA